MRTDFARVVANGQPLELHGDNLYLSLDLSASNLPIGSRVRVGEALLEVTPKALVEDLEPDYEELKKLVEGLGREDRKSDATLIAKDEAMREFDRVFRLTAGIIAAFFSLAGHEELARRVRPSSRRAGRTQADVEAEAKEQAAADETSASAEAQAES